MKIGRIENIIISVVFVICIAAVLYYVWKKYTLLEGFEDGGDKENKNKLKTIIPMDIYQTWHTKDLPPKMKECVEKLKRDNPEFTHHLYDEEMCRQFIKENYDDRVLKAYDKLKPKAFKSDLWRYCILFKKGGIYLDIKYECVDGFKLKNISNKKINVKEQWNRKYLKDAVNNGLIILPPGDTIMFKMITAIYENTEKNFYGNRASEITGPYLYGKFFNTDDIDNMKYYYYEKNNRGFIRDIETNKDILAFYKDYRKDQRNNNHNQKYWQEMWRDKEIYN